MNAEKFEKLIDKNKFQVFVFISPAWLPICFADHSWLVVNRMGNISRWEVLFQNKRKDGTDFGHLHKNFFLPWQGIEIIPLFKKILWPSKLLIILDNFNNPEVEKLVNIVENSGRIYPYWNKYFLTGPNSNTYVQWILNRFPELKIKLPWNAFGKNYKKSA
jgi:hypothetical protein